MFTYFQERMSTFSFDISYSWPNCVNNKMFESDWFLTAYIYSFILLQNFFQFDLSDFQERVIGQVKSDI